MNSRRPVPDRTMLYDMARVEALADGVFAVVVTLLVLDIRIPDTFQASVSAWLITNWQLFFGYFLSFWLAGLYWINYRDTFDRIRFADRPLLLWNLGFLFFVALLPFSATLISQHGNDQASPIVYSLNLFFIGIALFLARRHAIHTPSLLDSAASEDHLSSRSTIFRILAPSVAYIVVIVISLLGYPSNSYFGFLLVPLLRILLHRIVPLAGSSPFPGVRDTSEAPHARDQQRHKRS